MTDLQRPEAKQPPARRAARGGYKSRSGAEKRRLIIESAITVFAEKGYHETRISDIARHAEIAYGLVYHYFKNKEEILDTIFFERWGGFIRAVGAIAADGRSVEDKLLSIAAVILSAQRRRPEWVKVLIFEIQRTQRFADPERMEVVGRLFRTLADLLREGQARGELRDDLDPDLACYIFIGGLDIVVTGRAMALIEDEGEEGADYVRIARTVVDLFLNGMAREQRPSSGATSDTTLEDGSNTQDIKR
jgi:TetR/AcrR family fatty acid metabolism transcriptional regulator